MPGRLLAQPHDAQHRCDGAFAEGQQGPEQQALDMGEDAAAK